MALFSRRKKSGDDVVAPTAEAVASDSAPNDTTPNDTTPNGAGAVAGEHTTSESPTAEQPVEAPSIGISVQAFRGVGAEAGPEVSLPTSDGTSNSDAPSVSAAPAAPQASPSPPVQPETPQERRLPLASVLPPEQTETVAGMKDNVLLREALSEIEAGATNDQLLGVMRQALQGHLYIRVNGDARAQISEGKALSVAVVRDSEDNQYMLAFSSAGAVRDSVQLEADPSSTSAVAQPVTSVLQQVVSGDFAGLIVDNASAPHRVVFPTELLQKTLEQADVDMTVKSILAAPREQDSVVKVGEALATTRMWVAVNDGSGGGPVGIAEAQTTDGRRFLQLFSHPLEVIALGRGDRPLPFAPEQLAKVLTSHADIAGVIVDSAGPSIVVERAALTPVLVLAVDLGD
ncbi:MULTISPECIES: SseB family protein [unclassified Microbacterium]|uniref:SseB family protein n=1 Tax=unclassified Microbacterium TaxID=2609290 RepID=UPI000493465A|nr:MULTISPECIES: SseB family protein [unclassified Microbacterium]MCV0336091.1 SseB family protein [Microbacterium sp.]MCV0377019.1 SseB family protein [Microbacterium sp.]MCV0390478.1 SseB family protein [Microbacterium sp.]MCV0418213.1 SseB family protein [Microbacterium sp.]MCV0422119.1 SseB family protein [Microbacterium sp.]